MIEILVLILVGTILAVIWIQKRKKLSLPPGPIRWPVVGSIPQMIMENLSYPHLQLSGLAKKYGGILSFGYGVHFAVVVSDYEIMLDLFRRPETTLERFRFEFLEQRNNFKNLGIIWAYGDVWKEQRKYAVKQLRKYGFGKKESMDTIMQEEVTDLVFDIQKSIDNSDGIWEVDPNRLAACTLNILWASVGGYRFNPQAQKFQRHLDLQDRIFESLGPQNLLGAFPFLKIFPVLSGYKQQEIIQRTCRGFTLDLINDAKEFRQGRQEAESFVEAYLDEIELNRSNPNSNFTESQLVLILMDLFLAGADTTSAIFNWILLYLGTFRNVQSKARAEISAFTQKHCRGLSSADLAMMPYVHAVILESMRHSPFLFTSVARRVTENIECAGYLIPKGTCLMQNFYPIFHDKCFWGDPEVFRPDRLLQADGKLDPAKVDRIVQFGIGGRSCPGENVAMTSLFMITTGLLKTFILDTASGREPSLDPGTPAITLKPKPFVLKVTRIH